MRILGIDPGLAIVGFGLIEAETGKMQMLQYLSLIHISEPTRPY